MVYKNSSGSTSIVNDWGQWRYFNSALKKLGESNPAKVSITPKEPVVESEVNWMNVAGDVLNGAMGLFEKRRDLSYSLADDYLKTHSIEEYRKAMKEGSIPFQDDPIAMQRLKYDHGKLVFQMSEQDFTERVNKGEFVGLEPEQVDAIHYEHSKKSMNEVSDVFGYADGNDYWFNEGFFADSENGRIKSLLRNSEVTNDTLIRQRLNNDIAKTIALINSGQLTPDSLNNIIMSTYEELKYRYTPEDLATYANVTLKAIGESPMGDKLLEVVSNSKIPGSDITFREYVGSGGIDTIKKTSQNLRHNMDAKARYEFMSEADSLAENGDVLSLNTKLQRELSENGNTKTERTEYLYRALNKAREYQSRASKASSKKIVFDDASSDWASYLLNRVDGRGDGKSIADKKLEYKGTGFTATHMDVVAQNVVAKVFMEQKENPKRLKNLMALSADTYDTYPALRDAIVKNTNDYVSQFTPFVDEWVSRGTLDPNRGFETVEFKGVKGVPKPLADLMQIHDVNPSAFSRIAGEKALEYVKTAKMAMSLGKNPMSVIGNNERFLAEYKRKAQNEGNPLTTPRIGTHLMYGVKTPLNIDVDNQLDILAVSLAEEYRRKDSDVSLGDALKAGKDMAKSYYYQAGRTAIPRVYIESAFSGKFTPTEEAMVDVGWCVDKAFTDYMKSKNIKDYSLSFYDSDKKAVVIVGVDGVSKGELPVEELGRLTEKEYNKDLDRWWFEKTGRE